MTQLSFDDYTPKVRPDNPLRDMLLMYRADHGAAWVNASTLIEYFHMPHTEQAKRTLREWAEEDSDIISGNRGYCLICNALPDETLHSAYRLISQGKKMVKRGIRQMRRYHQMHGEKAKEVGV